MAIPHKLPLKNVGNLLPHLAMKTVFWSSQSFLVSSKSKSTIYEYLQSFGAEVHGVLRVRKDGNE